MGSHRAGLDGVQRVSRPGGVVILHDSRSVVSCPDLQSVRYTETVVRRDSRFCIVDEVDSMTILERRRECDRP